MLIKCRVNFYLEKRKGKKENLPIRMTFSYSGRRMEYYTGYRIDEDKWSSEIQRVKRNNLNRDGVSFTVINAHLDELAARVREIYTEQRALKHNPTELFLRDELKKRTGNDFKNSNFFDIFKLFVNTESKANTWTDGTVTKFNTNLAHLKDFEAKKHFKIDFDNIDRSFFSKYIDFQREDLNHRNTTISKNLKIFKWFMNWATKEGYNTNLAYKNYNPELKGTARNSKIIFLTWEELMKVYSMDIKLNYLAHVRDVFCFSCFTGLRYSDVYNLKHGNVKADTIELTTIKTDDTLTIDLNQYAKAILDKYKDIHFKNDKVLPVISNQKFNDYLKELGQLAELNTPETVVYFKGSERKEYSYQKWQLLTTHVGRKTFVSNALYLGIPAEVIMSWTGHKDHKMMEKYYRILGQQKKREMQKFNDHDNN